MILQRNQGIRCSLHVPTCLAEGDAERAEVVTFSRENCHNGNFETLKLNPLSTASSIRSSILTLLCPFPAFTYPAVHLFFFAQRITSSTSSTSDTSNKLRRLQQTE